MLIAEVTLAEGSQGRRSEVGAVSAVKGRGRLCQHKTRGQNASCWPWAYLPAPTAAAVAAAADADDLRRHSDASMRLGHWLGRSWMWPSRLLDACWLLLYGPLPIALGSLLSSRA